MLRRIDENDGAADLFVLLMGLMSGASFVLAGKFAEMVLNSLM